MFVSGRPQIHAGRQGRSEMFYHYQKNVLCYGSSVYLWETQAMMCAACSTHVCFALTFPPKRRPLLKKLFSFTLRRHCNHLSPSVSPPSSFSPLFSSPHCHYIAIFPSVLLSVVVNCVQRGASSSLYRLPSGAAGRGETWSLDTTLLIYSESTTNSHATLVQTS